MEEGSEGGGEGPAGEDGEMVAGWWFGTVPPWRR